MLRFIVHYSRLDTAHKARVFRDADRAVAFAKRLGERGYYTGIASVYR